MVVVCLRYVWYFCFGKLYNEEFEDRFMILFLFCELGVVIGWEDVVERGWVKKEEELLCD